MDIYPAKIAPTRLYIKRILRDNGEYIWYFGKSVSKNIINYKGSGAIWMKYITKYGRPAVEHVWNSDWYYDSIKLQEDAIAFSVENNIAESPLWANQLIENGIGSGKHTDTTKAKISKTLTGHKHSEETKAKISKSLSGENHPNHGRTGELSLCYGREVSLEEREKISKALTGRKNPGVSKSLTGIDRPKTTCPHCGKQGGDGAMSRWHFDNCKKKPQNLLHSEAIH